MDESLRRQLLHAQENEITEYHVYRSLAAREKDRQNRQVLNEIAEDERRHYEFWKEKTGEDVGPRTWDRIKYTWLARLAGLTFAVKLMERGEERAEQNYAHLTEQLAEAADIAADEGRHEDELLEMIDEQRLRYVGSIVLGLSDALVELTGALAGLTLALGDGRLIAMTGLITGIAASLSMAASEYLSTRAEQDHEKHAGLASLYTGGAYVVTVGLLILPFLLVPVPLLALGWSLAHAVLVILAFTFYVSVARDTPFGHRFAEMAGLCLGVAVVSFGVGYLVRVLFGVEA
ncbi:MAG: VIT1/CCC1 transporter family protein [bacterium]